MFLPSSEETFSYELCVTVIYFVPFYERWNKYFKKYSSYVFYTEDVFDFRYIFKHAVIILLVSDNFTYYWK